MLPSDSTVCFTTRASSRSKSITPTPTAIPRSTSPPSPCWACASARASVGPAPAHLPDRSQLRLRFACIFGQPRRPDHRHRADRRAMGPHGSTLRVAQNRPRHGVRGLKRLVGFSAKNRFYRANRDLGRIFKTEFILQYPLGAGTAPPDPARLAQGRATPRNLVLRVWLTSRSICIGANRSCLPCRLQYLRGCVPLLPCRLVGGPSFLPVRI